MKTTTRYALHFISGSDDGFLVGELSLLRISKKGPAFVDIFVTDSFSYVFNCVKKNSDET